MKCRFFLNVFFVFGLTHIASSYSEESHNLPLHLCAADKYGYSCATIGFQKPVEEDELYQSGCVDDFVIFHYGRNMKNIGAWAARATEKGVPSLAIPSKILEDKAAVFVNGIKLRKSYDQQTFEQIIPNYIEQKLRGRLHGIVENCDLLKRAETE